MLLGFLIAAFSILGSRTAETAVSLIIPVIALGLPIIDTSYAIARRWYQKVPLSAPDRRHIHHRLISMGLSHKKAVLLLYLVCILFGGAALLVTVSRNEVAVLVIGSLGIIVFVCIRVLGGLRFDKVLDKVSDDFRRGKRDSHARVSLEKAVHLMEEATGADALWTSCHVVLRALRLDYAKLHLTNPEYGAPRVLAWPGRQDPPDPELDYDEDDHWAGRLKVYSEQGEIIGELEVAKTIHSGPLLGVTPELIDRLRRELGIHLDRISSAGLAPEPPAAGTEPGGTATALTESRERDASPML
jgi:hypothetical protein